jgi:hypothetical protein
MTCWNFAASISLAYTTGFSAAAGPSPVGFGSCAASTPAEKTTTVKQFS